MTAADRVIAETTARKAPATARTAWDRLESWLDWASEFLNPILVKETRQALKSRQFAITFSLVLLAAWAWSVYGLAYIGPDASYRAEGPFMLHGYLVILAFPLLVVVPYAAFRSLAGEREDRTYELLSITSLSPSQVVSGKLASSVLQIIVYLSAIAPCLVFTYLLRGVDVAQIFFFLTWLTSASLAFSMMGLFIATLANERHWQIVLSVVVVIGAFLGFVGTVSLANEIVEEVLPLENTEFWISHGVFATIYVGYFALLFLAARARLTFASENRSTSLRIVMALHFAALAGWCTAPFLLYPSLSDPEILFGIATAFVIASAIHWYLMGVFLTGESPYLSPRVRRALPSSFLGRAFLTWFNPGPATGYMYSLSGVVTAVVLAGLGVVLGAWRLGQWEELLGLGLRSAAVMRQMFLWVALVMLCYVSFYLGVGRILTTTLRRWSPDGFMLPFVVHALVLLMGTGVPMVVQMSWFEPADTWEYSGLQVLNPFWTVTNMVFSQGSSIWVWESTWLAVLPLCGVLGLFINLPGIFAEVRFVRVKKPERVALEDEQKQRGLHPDRPVKTSPWD